jgi:Ran GTPase-activating protein (RanGAP) involved in mRNA processing and transport
MSTQEPVVEHSNSVPSTLPSVEQNGELLEEEDEYSEEEEEEIDETEMRKQELDDELAKLKGMHFEEKECEEQDYHLTDNPNRIDRSATKTEVEAEGEIVQELDDSEEEEEEINEDDDEYIQGERRTGDDNSVHSEVEGDNEDRYGRKAFMRKCQEFDHFSFPVTNVIEKLDRAELDLSHHGMGDKGVAALAEALKYNSKIKRLILHDNAITAEGVEALVEGLRRNKSIDYLDLSNNRLGYKGMSKTFGPVFSEMLDATATLKHLSLKGNKIGDGDMKFIAEALSENFNLVEIDLSYCELGVKSGEMIGAMLSTNVDLKKINLEWNILCNQGTKQLLAGLKNNNVLKDINLAWNGLSDQAAKEIGAVLFSNTSLEVVNLGHNRITHEGTKLLAGGLKENSALKVFNISANPIEKEGVQLIINAIADNQCLTELYMLDCCNTDLGAMHELNELLTKTLKNKRNLKTIAIGSSKN